MNSSEHLDMRFPLTVLVAVVVFFAPLAMSTTPSAPTNLRFDGSVAAGIYTGVPDPAGTVPSAIFPDLPSKDAQIQAFPYDPINDATPTWNDEANQYWVDNGGACDDANNGGRGSPAEPRCTIFGLVGVTTKTWTLNAGDQVFVVGDGNTYVENNNISTSNFNGTAENPIWVIGVSSDSTPRWLNQPKLEIKVWKQASGFFQHIIFDNLHFFTPTNDFELQLGTTPARTTSNGTEIAATTNPAEYVTFRKVTCSSVEDPDAPGVFTTLSKRCFNVTGTPEHPTRFVVIYDSDIFGRGYYEDDMDITQDIHGVQMQEAVYYFWYLNNRSFHLQADSIQCSNSNQLDFEYNERPHYIYVSGNEFYENYENAWDSKGCYHVVFSDNIVHDFVNQTRLENNAGMISPNDGESYIGSNYEWYLNNKFYATGNPFAPKMTSEDAFIYIMGNLAVDMKEVDDDHFEGFLFMQQRCVGLKSRSDLMIDGELVPSGTRIHTCGSGMYVGNNTVDCQLKAGVGQHTQNGSLGTRNPDGSVDVSGVDGNTHFVDSAEEQDQKISIVGNVFYNCNDAGGGSPIRWESINSNFIVNYDYNVDFRTAGGDITLSPFNDSEIGNLTNSDPLLVNPDGTINGDYSLGAGSPARRLIPTEDDAYQTFSDLYGLDIRVDLNGKRWRKGAVISPGAIQ